MFNLFKTVGNNRENREDDVFAVKDALSDFGYFDFSSNVSEPHGIFTRELDDGIKSFQAENGLRVDGVLKPKGETENALRQRFVAERKEPDTGFVFAQKREREFDATGRRIREKPQSIFEAVARSFPNPQRQFGEEAIKRKLQERQVRLASATNTTPQAQASQKPSVPVPAGKPVDSKYRPTILKGLDNKKVVDAVIEEEGNPAKTNYMFKDTADGGGKVTVAGGILLDSVDEAKKLPFEIKDQQTGQYRRATKQEIEHAYKKVDAIKQPRAGNKYTADKFDPIKGQLAKPNNLDDLILPEAIAKREFDERLRRHAGELRRELQDFDTYPPSAQQAILDMHFNLGATKFREVRMAKNPKTGKLENQGWPKLYAAIKNRDWATAALESKRGGVSNDRNKNTANKFLEAAREQKAARAAKGGQRAAKGL